MKDLPQGTTKSHLDEILEQIDELYPELYEFVDDGGTQGYVPCGEEVKSLFLTSLASLLEKYGEEICPEWIDNPYGEVSSYTVGRRDERKEMRTKLKEIINSLK